MRSGVKRPEVRNLQVLLRDEGLYTGKIDGWYGNYTRNAVYRLQKRLGVLPNGHWTADSVAAWDGDQPEPPTETAAPVYDELEALRAEAHDLGVDVDGRWGLNRLRKEIAAAQHPSAKENPVDEPAAPVVVVSADGEGGGVDSEPPVDEADGGTRPSGESPDFGQDPPWDY